LSQITSGNRIRFLFTPWSVIKGSHSPTNTASQLKNCMKVHPETSFLWQNVMLQCAFGSGF
jgi:hypothetical protein